ncbi:MAG: bifunctional (p)ppGpp synthetase/guanosine-3',5'-bis(diphosphate) 3'-pyrophosphohydrolase [Treponema bryantii]|nr:bifunctional (p)ppGpp synthetase/guanosine-3',5'-bis(diphosphate) 3'-pyrophosphohydrolase [Treponema bryantii]
MSVDKTFNSDANDTKNLINEFFEMNDFYSADDVQLITKAWERLVELSSQITRPCGEPFYLHPLRVANILAQSKLDATTILACFFHAPEPIHFSIEDIQKEFGKEVASIVEQTSKIMTVSQSSRTLQQSDAIRKMLFALVDDVRIILIKLADKLDRIRNAKSLTEEEQHSVAEEIIDIWAPLADRLGMQAEKNELEDLSLKYTNPAVFQQIKSIVSQKKDERANYLEKATQSILQSAQKSNLQITITSRAKHFYSIYQKMRKRNKEAGELFDLFALRILCNTNADCYTLIGIVHSLWKPLDGRFKDYIAMPKANGYQSLHTTVMCDGRPLEIQIRTYEMHNMAEHGVASHWLYKKGTNHDLVEPEKLELFNKLQELKESHITDENFFKTLKNELLGDEIYVFTPKGDVKKLPAGSNAIDFAYSIHSAIGEKIVAAKADGKIIPLTEPLKNTQIIEVITNPQAHPTENQLKVVKTSKAHQKIHSWLATNDPTFSDKLIQQQKENAEIVVHQKKKRVKSDARPIPEEQTTRKVRIDGSINFLFTLAKCCNPKYPDPIVGYISRIKGVSVHRADCLTYQRIQNKEQRSIDVSWNE